MVRLFVNHPLLPGREVPLGPQQSHYLLHVMRMKQGDVLLVFNGKEGEMRASLASVLSKRATLRLEDKTRPQVVPSFQQSLFFAPLKAHRLDMMIEKTTEMGVNELIPCLTERTSVRRLNPHRLMSIAIEAAEQSARLTVPCIAPFDSLQNQLARKREASVILFCDINASYPYLSKQFDRNEDLINVKKSVGFLIGPEGGWSAAERALLETFIDIIPARLGVRTFRAETASFVALTLFQSWLEGQGKEEDLHA